MLGIFFQILEEDQEEVEEEVEVEEILIDCHNNRVRVEEKEEDGAGGIMMKTLFIQNSTYHEVCISTL